MIFNPLRLRRTQGRNCRAGAPRSEDGKIARTAREQWYNETRRSPSPGSASFCVPCAKTPFHVERHDPSPQRWQEVALKDMFMVKLWIQADGMPLCALAHI